MLTRKSFPPPTLLCKRRFDVSILKKVDTTPSLPVVEQIKPEDLVYRIEHTI